MRARQVILLIVTFGSLALQYLINSGATPLLTTAEVAGRETVVNYTLPPDYAFAIWGLIYLCFVAYAVYGAAPSWGDDLFYTETWRLAAVSLLLNLVWTVFVGLNWWVAAYPLQWIMLVIAVILLKRALPFSRTRDRYLTIPFALYAGWLAVALIPFTADLLNSTGWRGAPLGPRTWGVIMYIAAVVITMTAYVRGLRHPAFPLPAAWALFTLGTRFGGMLRLTAWSGALLLLGIAVSALIVNRQTPIPNREY